MASGAVVFPSALLTIVKIAVDGCKLAESLTLMVIIIFIIITMIIIVKY